MPALEWSSPQLRGFTPTLRARLFAPVGPPQLRTVAGAGARVYAAPGRYCVNYVIEAAEQLIVVDVGSGEDVPRLARLVRAIGKPVGLLVATHLHFDHVLGMERAAARFAAPIALSPLGHAAATDGRRMRPVARLGMPHFWRTWVWQGLPPFHRLDMPRGLGVGFPWSRNRLRASLTDPLEDGDRLPGAAGWRVLLTPGHADDALCLFHAASGLLVAGDTVRNFLGGEWNPLITDRAAYERTIARLLQLEVRAALPGHGPPVVGERLLSRLAPLPR